MENKSDHEYAEPESCELQSNIGADGGSGKDDDMMKFEDFIAMEEEQELVATETKREEEDTGEDGQREEVRQELVDGEFEQW